MTTEVIPRIQESETLAEISEKWETAKDKDYYYKKKDLKDYNKDLFVGLLAEQEEILKETENNDKIQKEIKSMKDEISKLEKKTVQQKYN